ncbi:MAG: Fe-S cluster assembly ATPase SufC [Candidatus Komeilibacteria bacterium RIFCSPLOWO2_01_FULL_52_15]|uniref:Fe-S cluster assembly ATPase SufC n=2 Tax=Candidatus Komeiliibacteriota TaxID=1817908 RepID=A0A1G2BS36_9BACT|nr:MAG: Fe-S cluster assembly ATPase SufC [Candidatus Komeilibacteria bacterium RIFCSPHIGHO2_01_FULL_52_14]OGY91901.1 MAG: Fe-S cluster assembly ATPase SufC [Candidatus Komeilibacteria bacterium RIFCSPLOWO2_01_FULL_52_15]
MKKLLVLENLSVTVDGTKIIDRLTLSIGDGELHVLMGPNGSGKSTLAYALAGKPSYSVTAKKIRFDGKDLIRLSPEKRARLGLFLAFQYPLAVPGISLYILLPEMARARHARERKKNEQHLTLASALAREQQEQLKEVRTQTVGLLRKLALPDEMLYRSLNDQFSGGEKKKAEIVQLFAARPKLAILDEPDSGLDVDALKKIAGAIGELHRSGTAVLLITHYSRILKYLKPDRVHIMHHGTLARSGTADLAKKIERFGYESLLAKQKK